MSNTLRRIISTAPMAPREETVMIDGEPVVLRAHNDATFSMQAFGGQDGENVATATAFDKIISDAGVVDAEPVDPEMIPMIRLILRCLKPTPDDEPIKDWELARLMVTRGDVFLLLLNKTLELTNFSGVADVVLGRQLGKSSGGMQPPNSLSPSGADEAPENPSPSLSETDGLKTTS